MPRTNIGISPEERALTDEIREHHGNMLSAREVGAYLGLKNVKSYMAFLDGVPAFDINGRRKYRAVDLAHKLMEVRV